MNNSIVRLFSANTSPQNALQAICERRANILAQIAQVEAQRPNLALSSASGDREATAELSRVNSRLSDLRQTLADIETAHDAAEGQVAEANRQASDEQRAKDMRRLDKLMVARLSVTQDVALHLRDALKALQKSEDMAGEIVALHNRLGGFPKTEGDGRYTVERTLTVNAMSDRVIRYMISIGLSKYLGTDTPTLLRPVLDLVEAEATAQARYAVQEGPDAA